MKKLLRTRPIWIPVFTPILAALLLIFGYDAIAKARRAETRPATSQQDPDRVFRMENDNDDDPEYIEMRREYMSRLFGTAPGGFSPAAYTDALAATRALPPTPLVPDRGGDYSLNNILPWTFPVPPPLGNDWGGGAGARIDAIAVHPTDGNTVYVSSEGGLAKSTDGGTNWSYLSNSLSSQSIRSIAIDPIAPNIVYAGTGTQEYYGKGIYRSFDSGATWTTVGATEFTGSTVAKILIDPASAGGQSRTTLYASVTRTDQTHRIWKSTNSGTTWTQKRVVGGAPWWSGGFYDIAIDPAAPSTVYITAPDGVFKSTDGGTTWGTSLHLIPDNLAPSHLAFAQSVLYLAYKNGSAVIEKSTNQGASWTTLNSPSADVGCFGVDPVHPNRIFVGGGGDLRYSLDSGNTWTSSGNVHVDMHSIAFAPNNTDRNYLGTDGGIYRADYAGSGPVVWTDKNQNLAGCLMQGISLSSDGHMVMGNQDNGNQMTAGYTSPWTMVRGGDGFRPQIDQTNSQKFYYVGLSYGHPVDGTWVPLWRWLNGVQSDITPPGAFGENSSIFPGMGMSLSNSARVLVGFQHVWRSVDSGASWTRIGGSTTPPIGLDGGTIDMLYEAPSNTSVIYAIGHGNVFVTSDAHLGTGAHWTNITSGLPGGGMAIAVHPTDHQTAYIAAGPGIYKTANMGGSWTPENVVANALYHDIVIDPANPDRLFAASHVTVYSRYNGVWGPLSSGIPAGMTILSLSFNATSRQLAAATYGRGAYLLNLDNVPPTVSITSPANGATVAGTIVVSATAADNHQVAGVLFKVDGITIGTEDTSFPYSVNWNTALPGTGQRTLTALARDVIGNTTLSAPITVTVTTNK